MASRKSDKRLSSKPCSNLLTITILVAGFAAFVVDGCILMMHGWEPKTVEERTSLADMIVSGTVLRVLRHQLAWDKTYPADILVSNVYKGYELFNKATPLRESEIQAEYRSYYPFVYRVERFGDRRHCWSEVAAGRNYMMFLTTDPSPRDLAEGTTTKGGLKLVATYDDIAGASVDYNKETEDNLLNILGWRPWVSWTSCSEECGGGYQTRRRVCVHDVPNACEGEAKQKRRCSTFPCSGFRDLKKNFSLMNFPPGVRRAPGRWTAYRISLQARNIHVPTSHVYGKTFPYQFSILLTIKPKMTQRKNHGDSYALLFTTEDGAIEFGLKIAQYPSVVYRRVDGSLHELNFTEYPLDRSWHYLAVSVSKHSVTLIADCREVTTMDIEKSDRQPIDATGWASIGQGRGFVNNVYFEGDIDQLVIIDDPAAAQLQCDPHQRKFPELLETTDTTTLPGSVNGMDASIDIGLVYANLFNPFTFIDDTTPSSPVLDTTFPLYFDLDDSSDSKTTAAPDPRMTSPSTKTKMTTQRTKPRTTEFSKQTTSKATSTPQLTIRWDNSMNGPENNDKEIFAGDVNAPVTPGEFGAEKVSIFKPDVDFNGATIGTEEPINQGKLSASTTSTTRSKLTTATTVSTKTPATKNSNSPAIQMSETQKTRTTTKHVPTTLPPTKRTKRVTPGATTLPPPPPPPITTRPLPSTSLSTTTTTPSTTTPVTVPSTTTRMTTTRMTTTMMTTTRATTTATTTQPLVVHTTDMNEIVGEVDDDNNGRRPLNDGPPGSSTFNGLPGGAPAEIPSPSIMEYGQPVDDMANWSTWSTCSRTCGTGTRYRYTVCEPGSALRDCRNGRGIAAEHKACKLNNDCRGSLRWSGWSSCSRSCGSGFETRVAFCRDREAHPNCTEVGKLLIERRSCEALPECPAAYCPHGCMNGGVCSDGGVCRCPSGYDGRFCERELCDHSCKNGGQCIGKNKCLCPYGHLPPFCEPRCNPPCQNNGRCLFANRCVCPPGYTGRACNQPICQKRCHNGGVCISPDQCRCRDGYTGPDCRQPVCSPSCEHGGQCIRAGYCRCPKAYRGMQCQIAYCRRSCLNGGRCSGADTCTCPRGFTGSICQQSMCPKGCPGGSQCVGPNRCSARRHNSPSSRRRTWCPLQSYKENYIVTYVKPAIQKYRVPCGAYNLKTCESSRIIYQIGYRKSERTAYKCAPYG